MRDKVGKKVYHGVAVGVKLLQVLLGVLLGMKLNCLV